MTLTMKSLQEQINELRNEVAVLKAVEKTRKDSSRIKRRRYI